MFSRPICSNQALPVEFDDCIYRCFESYRQRVLQLRAERKAKLQRKQQQQQQQQQPSFGVEHNEDVVDQPSSSSIYQSEVVQGLLRYEIPIESTTVTIPVEEWQQNELEYSNIDQSVVSTSDITDRKKDIDTSIVDLETKEAQQTSQQVECPHLPPITNQTTENVKDSMSILDEKDRSKNTENVTSSSKTTGTLEYAIETSYSEVPILNQSNSITYASHLSSADKQQYDNTYISQVQEENYDFKTSTNEQNVVEQLPSSFYDEKQENFLYETDLNETLLLVQTTSDIYKEPKHIETHALIHDCMSNIQSIRSLSPSRKSDVESNDDEKEDKAILDLRECICHCYANIKNSWIKDQQQEHAEPYHYNEQPILKSITPNIQPYLPSSITPCIQQIIQQSNAIPYMNCDQNEQLQQNVCLSEIKYVDSWTQTKALELSTQYYVPQQIYEQTPFTFDTVPHTTTITTTSSPTDQTIEYRSPTIIETSEAIPSLSKENIIYDHIIPTNIHYSSPPRIPIHEEFPNIPFRHTDEKIPPINQNTNLCLVPCREVLQDAYVPSNIPTNSLYTERTQLPMNVSPPEALPVSTPQHQRACAVCCCVPGKSLIKKIVYKQIGEENQYEKESYIDYGSIIDQLETRVNVRYGNYFMEEEEKTSLYNNYNEQLRVYDFPVYICSE